MTCSGIDVESGKPIEISFDETIRFVRDAHSSIGKVYLAPGFIDIQVNGFAAVDYNDPATPRDESARCLQALFATALTGLYPTASTGAPDRVVAALCNVC